MSEMEKSEAPTLFQVNGPVGLANWKDYCYDLSGSQLYGELTSDSFALKDGDAVAAIAYVIETYGIIYNKELLTAAGYTQDDIKGFDDLKKVADDIQARKAELGVDGAFTSAGMDGSSDWRFKTHLANLPIYYEYKADGIGSTDAIKGTYLTTTSRSGTCTSRLHLRPQAAGFQDRQRRCGGIRGQEGCVLSERHLGLRRCFQPG